MSNTPIRRGSFLLLTLFVCLVLAGCNLSAAPEEPLNVTNVPTGSQNATRTPSSNSSLPTARPVTRLPLPTSQVRPPGSTAVSSLPQPILLPTITPMPVSIVILSPIPGNVVAGNVQVLGAASHPQFLQYQVEFGPDPNPGNLWYPATSVVQTPVSTYALLGIWNTTSLNDGLYQLRLRVFLRDGSNLQTVVNNIRVQNQAPTPVPTSTPNIPRPIAAFTQDLSTGNAPLVVRFFNQSTGEITSYSWDFGDGGFSNEQNPIHIYNNPGLFNVTLTVSGPGGSSNVSRQINVQSVSAPVAAFVPDRSSGTPPLNIQFNNQSTGQITTYEWNFGDGGTSSAASPSHQYTTAGTYNVILRVIGPGGTSSATRQITVVNPQVAAPNAAFRPDTAISGDLPFTIQFENASTGEVTGYNWNFGDGTSSAEQNPAHIFTEAGTYTVSLTVAGPGGQDTAEIQVEVIRPPDAPTASFNVEGETTGTAPFTVTFTNTSQGDIDQTTWDFDDGETSTSTDTTLTHEFTEPGTYEVTLTVTNESGTDTATTTITALPQQIAPEALFTLNPTSGNAPLEVTVTNQSTGNNLTYAWNFGDGETSDTNNATFTHTFNDAGTFVVSLTVTDTVSGLSDDYRLPVEVGEGAPAPAPISASFNAVETSPLNYSFEATATGGTEPYTFAWDFGDGQTGQGQSVTHTYGQGGDYTVTLTVTDATGTTATSTQPVTGTPPTEPLNVSFTATENQPLTFDFQATAAGGTPPYTFAWDFGDGQTGEGETTSHTYTQGGTFTVNLTVTDSTAATANSQQDVTTNAPEEPALQETTTVLPSNVNEFFNALNPVYQAGLTRPTPNRRDAFAVIGDETTLSPAFLRPFAVNDPPTFRLDDTTTDLQTLIDRYNTTGSFTRQSVATGNNFTAQTLLEPGANYSAQCDQPGETLIQCELRLAQAGVAVINVGYNDVLQQTDPAAFAEQLRQIIQSALDSGVVPVVSTVYPRLGDPVTLEQTRRINNAIIETAASMNVPVFNQWAAFDNLPDSGLTGENTPSIDPNVTEGAGFLTEGTTYGANARNLYLLRLLNTISNTILQ
ncbi:MAG: PKD domain-containing protein [bacterium]|nr:PKD domain-containing protein [bacterium]